MRSQVDTAHLLAEDGRWYPHGRRIEWLVDVAVHAIGLVLAVLGCVILVWTAAASGSVKLTAAMVIYSAGLLAMLICSTLCNANTDRRLERLFQHFDLSGIFLMIAGSYTPFMLAKLEGPVAWTVLAVVWVAALTGVALNLLARWHAPRVYIGLYLTLGWAVLSVIHHLVMALSPLGLGLLAAGGLLYTIGVVFHVNKKLPFNQAIWHGFVIAAATCHFLAIYFEVAAYAV
jgi:hemolysin III